MPYTGPIADTHIHIQPWHQLDPKVLAVMRRNRPDMDLIEQCIDSPSRLLHFLDEAGIQRALLVNYPSPAIMGFDLSVNDFIGQYVRGHESRLIACGGILPALVEDISGYLRHLKEDLGIRCIKLHPPHQQLVPNAYLTGAEPRLAEMYETCAALGLPVMIHTGTSVFPGARSRFGDPLPVDDVAVDFPELTIILAHCGRPFWTEEAFFLVRRFPRVFADLSGIPPARMKQYLPRLPEIADKLLWGTDWPSPGVLHPRYNLDVFLESDYPDEVMAQICWGNAGRIFGW